MNERIKDLIKSSDLDYDELWTKDQLAVDKFAELIVKETLLQMVIQMNRFGDDQSNNPAWYKSEEAVKKHFGVEE